VQGRLFPYDVAMASIQEDLAQTLNNQLLHYNRIVGIAVTFIIGGAVFYHYVEKFSWLNSFYFTVVTLATVGYGDFVPKTAIGKIFTMFYIFVGITIFVVLAKTVLAKGASRRIEHRNKKEASR